MYKKKRRKKRRSKVINRIESKKKNAVKVKKKWWWNETNQSKLKPTQNHNSKQKSKLQLPPLPALLKVQNERHWIILSSHAKPLAYNARKHGYAHNGRLYKMCIHTSKKFGKPLTQLYSQQLNC